jgi:alpha-mannosidase
MNAQTSEPPGPYKPELDRLQAMTVVPLEDWRIHAADLPHPEIPDFSDSGWATAKGSLADQDLRLQGAKLAGPLWFRREVEIPRLVGGRDITGARVRFDFRAGVEGDYRVRVFFNGNMVSQQDQDTRDVVLVNQRALPGEKIVVAVGLMTLPETIRFGGGRLLVDFPDRGVNDPLMLRYEIIAGEEMLAAYPDARARHAPQLDAAVKALDFNALDRGDQAGFEHSLRAANEALSPVREWMKEYRVAAVGNSHIDMAWLWPWTETVEVVRNTYGTVLQLMREYPDFHYTQSSPQTFEWMEEKYPEIFQQIQERVKEGRWELIGGMWVEPDLNMPTGESLARQLLIGKRYFRQKFGVDVRIGWNPDSFGYSWQLPQIYKKSGIDYFMTQKLFWNDTTRFPYKLFWWQSPDGSRVLTYFPREVANKFEPAELAADVAGQTSRTGYPEILYLYGVGDHGGSPTRTMLDEAHRLQDPQLAFPQINFTTAHGFFEGIEQSLNKLKVPVWNDEVYFEYHRGIMTTQSETKKRIRQNEELLLNAEKFCSIAMLYGLEYPHDRLERAWKRVLFDEFHDIMPGSGIAVNYLDAQRELEEASLIAQNALGDAQRLITAHINTGGSGVPVVVFNPLNWARTDPVETTVQFSGPVSDVEVRAANGKSLISAVVSRDASDHALTVRFLADSVPGLGYEVVHVVPLSKPTVPASTLKASADSLENEFVRVKVDPKTGCITSLFDKRSGRETLAAGACGNLLQAFRDKPQDWDAWNIDADFEKQKWDITDASEVRLIENTPVRAVIRVKKAFQNSTFTQDITLYPGVPRVDINMQVDWHEKHILVKAAFPVTVESDFATYQIPYGTIRRPTTRNTPAERAKFEVSALQWGDLSDSSHGFSLLNASKYGYDAKGNVIRLSLLRSPEWPDPHADEGFHEFTYSLYPHPGDWKEGGTERQGYQLNYPLMAVPAATHEGVLPPSHSFVQVDAPNVVLSDAKKAEDGGGVVVHFYEFAGERAQVHLQLPAPATRAAETDLMEKELQPLPLENDGRQITVPTRPYEIKSVEVWFKKGVPANPPAREVAAGR